jgi:hypothetical protein
VIFSMRLNFASSRTCRNELAASSPLASRRA